MIWYPKPHPLKTTVTRTTYGSHGSPNEEPLEANDCEEFPLLGDPESSAEVDRASVEEMAPICTSVRPSLEFRTRIRDIPSYQRFILGYLLLAIVVFSLIVCVNTHSAWGIFAPLVVAVVLFGALLYRNYREGRMHFADSLLAWLDGCCADQPVQSTWLTREQAYE